MAKRLKVVDVATNAVEDLLEGFEYVAVPPVETTYPHVVVYSDDFDTDDTGVWEMTGNVADNPGSDPSDQPVVQDGALYAGSDQMGTILSITTTTSVVTIGVGNQASDTAEDLTVPGLQSAYVEASVLGGAFGGQATFKIVRTRSGVNVDIATDINISTSYSATQNIDIGLVDIANGDVLTAVCTSTTHIQGSTNFNVRVEAILVGFDHVIGVEISNTSGDRPRRMGFKAVFAPGAGEPPVFLGTTAPVAAFRGRRARLGFVDAEEVGGFFIKAYFWVEEYQIHVGGANVTTVAHSIDFAAGGTWWFTLDVDIDESLVVGGIWTSEPPITGGTPDYSYTAANGTIFEGNALRPAFGGGGQPHVYGASFPSSDSHYDDFFVAVSRTVLGHSGVVLTDLEASHPAWELDGERIAFYAAVRDGGSWIINSDGTGATPIMDGQYRLDNQILPNPWNVTVHGLPIWTPESDIVLVGMSADASQPPSSPSESLTPIRGLWVVTDTGEALELLIADTVDIASIYADWIPGEE